jgi:hypothetical protein
VRSRTAFILKFMFMLLCSTAMALGQSAAQESTNAGAVVNLEPRRPAHVGYPGFREVKAYPLLEAKEPEMLLKSGEKVKVIGKEHSNGRVKVLTNKCAEVYVDSFQVIYDQPPTPGTENDAGGCHTDAEILAYCKAWAADKEHIPIAIANGSQQYVCPQYLLGHGGSEVTRQELQTAQEAAARIPPCCTDWRSVMAYCKAWAADTEHIPVLPPGQNEDCPHFLFRQATHCVSGWDCNDASCSGSEYNCKVTSQEAQTAYEALSTKEKNDWLAGVGRRMMVTSGAEPPLATRRCTKEDFRSPGEQAADPVCVQKRKEEAEQKAKFEAKFKAELALIEKRKANYQAATQGIRIGQPQAVVKAMLQARGFAMPWTCSGGMNASGEWTSSCAAFRGQLRLVLYFSIYQRVRVVDPDTGIPHFINEKTDRLTDIFGFNPGYDLVGEEHGKSR